MTLQEVKDAYITEIVQILLRGGISMEKAVEQLKEVEEYYSIGDRNRR